MKEVFKQHKSGYFVSELNTMNPVVQRPSAAAEYTQVSGNREKPTVIVGL